MKTETLVTWALMGVASWILVYLVYLVVVGAWQMAT